MPRSSCLIASTGQTLAQGGLTQCIQTVGLVCGDQSVSSVSM